MSHRNVNRWNSRCVCVKIGLMKDLLLRKLIPDYDRINDLNVRRAYGNLSGTVGITVNAGLFALKLFAGIAANSSAVIGDSINSLTDGVTSLMTMLAYRAASKPADAGHPFGHGRLEYVIGLAVSELILAVGAVLMYEGINKIIHPQDIIFRMVTVVILIISIFAKLMMYLFNQDLSVRIGSPVLKATAIDSLNDVMTSSAVLGSFILSRMFPAVPFDAITTIIVAALIIKTGFSMAKDLVSQIVGRPCEAVRKEEIEETISHYPEIYGIHDLILHDYGPGRLFGSVHAEMSSDLSLKEAHSVLEHAEEEILEKYGIHMVIHADPVDPDDPVLDHYKKLVTSYLDRKNLSAHDIHLEGNVLKFDIMMKNDETNREAVTKGVTEAIHEVSPDMQVQIGFDYDFTEKEEA